MLVQLAALREIRYALSTLFTLTPFLFSAVVFLIGLGALAARRVTVGTRDILGRALVFLPIVVLPLFALTVWLSQVTMDRTADMLTGSGPDYITAVVRAFVVVGLLGYGPFFVLQGFIFSLYFREGREEGSLSRLYAIDLGASGIAALVGGVLALQATPVESVRLAWVSLLAALWFGRRYLGLAPTRTVAATIIAIVILGGEWGTGTVTKLEEPTWLAGEASFSTWTPYRRIDVHETLTDLAVYADGLAFQYYRKADDRTHEGDLRILPATLAAEDETLNAVLVVGSGSGADVRILRNRIARPLEITAVELDEGFVRAARNFAWLWEPYQTARIVVGEGRYFLATSDETFDMIVYAYVDPQSAVSKLGIPDANFLYTDSGVREAYSRLRSGGYFVLNRFYLAQQGPEFFSQLCATIESAGIDRDEVRLYRSAETIPWGSFGSVASATVLVRKGGPAPDLATPLVEEVAWAENGRPTTDFYPFSMVMDAWFGTLLTYVSGWPAAMATLIVAALLLAWRLATSLGHTHFFLLGFVSFLVESLVLLNSFLLFGNPTLSAALAIGFFLLWGGVGSWLSGHLATRRGFYLAVPAAVLFYAVTGPILHAATMGTSTTVRAAAFATHLLVVGVPVGAMFPISLRSFSGHSVASMFFVDLVGCALAPVLFWLMMSFVGVPLVALVSVAGYGAVALVLARR